MPLTRRIMIDIVATPESILNIPMVGRCPWQSFDQLVYEAWQQSCPIYPAGSKQPNAVPFPVIQTNFIYDSAIGLGQMAYIT